MTLDLVCVLFSSVKVLISLKWIQVTIYFLYSPEIGIYPIMIMVSNFEILVQVRVLAMDEGLRPVTEDRVTIDIIVRIHVYSNNRQDA